MSFLTLFTAPKPFTNPHIALIQYNAIRSWMNLGSDVEILLLGDEPGIAETANELGVRHCPNIKRNTQGTPLVSSLFETARENSSGLLLGYINADILLLPDLLTTTRQVASISNNAAQASSESKRQILDFLIIGQRWDLDVRTNLEFLPGWDRLLREQVHAQGKLHKPVGSDYFIFPRQCFSSLPDFAIGRSGWDNWMIFQARAQGWRVVDATAAALVIHQEHDYSHLPGGKSHYHLPESDENIRLAGGRRMIFKLADANCQWVEGKLQRPALTWKRWWREIEVFPLIHLHSTFFAYLFFAFFHPLTALWELRVMWHQKRLAHKRTAQ